MKKIFVLAFLIFSIMFGTMLVAPSLINIDKYKKLIIETVRLNLGRDFKINGPTRVKLFPFPSIILSDVELSSLQGEKAVYTIRADSINVTFSLLKFYLKDYQVTDITMSDANINFEVLEQNKKSWDFLYQMYKDDNNIFG